MDKDADLITQIARDLQGLSLPPPRAVEIAAEVNRLNTAIRGNADALSFDDEPAGYAALLAKAAPR